MPFERTPKPTVTGELLITAPSVLKCSTCGETPVPDKYYGSKCGCSPALSVQSKTRLDELHACRETWEASDRSVPFPDYWVGWQAAKHPTVVEKAFARAGNRRTQLEDAFAAFGFEVSWNGAGTVLAVTGEQSQGDIKDMLSDTLAELEAAKLREATLAGQLNAALQPTLDGDAFKKLRKERDALAKALLVNNIGFGFGADGSLATWRNAAPDANLRKAGVDVVGLRSAVAQVLKYVSRAELRELLKDGEQP